MKLQILVPQYKEDEKILCNLLNSIEIQQNVDLERDVGVIIVNDGSDVKLSKEFLNKYSFKINYIQAEHRGVSATRNTCLDAAKADYVMFCDADDMFFNACGLYIIFREIKMGGFDTLSSTFIEENKDPKTGETVYLNRELDSTFVHGKVHRRKYLLENNIRWNDNLTIHEDSYFNCLCQSLTKDVKYSTSPFYLWKWRDESVCRHDDKYILKTYNNMLDSNTMLVNEFLNRKMEDKAQFFATSMIIDAYFTMNKKEWLHQENKDYRIATQRRFKKYYLEFKNLFDKIDETEKAKIIIGIKNRMFTEGLLMESITFDDWIKEVMQWD